MIEFTATTTYSYASNLEDKEDISEGLKALADDEGTITWEQYQGAKDDLET